MYGKPVPGMPGYSSSNASRSSSTTTSVGSTVSGTGATTAPATTTSGPTTSGPTTSGGGPTLESVTEAALDIVGARRLGTWSLGGTTLNHSLQARVYYLGREYGVHISCGIGDFRHAAARLYDGQPVPAADTLLLATLRGMAFHLTIEVLGTAEQGNPRFFSRDGRFTAPATSAVSQGLADALTNRQAGSRLYREWAAVQDEVNTIFRDLAVAPVRTTVR